VKRAVGIDGWRLGWVAVALRDGAFEEAFTALHLDEVIAHFADAAAFAVDIPIGLSESGTRDCDLAARALIGKRWPSVFLAPQRAALGLARYAEALAVSPGLSRQAFGLLGKITEAAASADPRLREVHPEVSFWAMAGRHLPDPKKTWAGMHDRLDILRLHGIELPASDLGPAGSVPPDDLLDAAAAAWTATRLAAGTAESVGDELARIWY
jgi:predicted RNase H-like nuclease